jgi:hypothetical protein
MQIRWGKVRAEPTGLAALAVDDPLSPTGPQRGFHLSAFRDRAADLLSLVAAVRSARPHQPGRSLASSASSSAADLDRGTSPSGARSSPRVSPLGQGQAGRAAPAQRLAPFHFHGGSHPGRSEAPRRVGRSAASRRSAKATEEDARAPVGLSKAPFLAHSAARRSGATRHQGTAARTRRGAETLLGARYGFVLGRVGGARTRQLAAAHFLDTLLNRMPFPIAALQVDGVSEFAAEFETACQQRGLPLFV